MIYFTVEGDFKKIGLNLYFARGGFVATWVWYAPSAHELTCWRFRLRMHIAPRILLSVDRCNVIDNYLSMRKLSVIESEVLIDFKRAEQHLKSLSDSNCLVNHERT